MIESGEHIEKRMEEETRMQDRLAKAIQLREMGRAKQDQTLLEEARTLLLELVAAYPNEAEIPYQAAIVHDNLGLERAALPFYTRTLEQGLSGSDTTTKLM